MLDLGIRLPGSETAAGTNNLSRVDYAIKAAGEEFVRRTRCTIKTNDTLTLTADSEAFDTSGVGDFDPSRLAMVEVRHPTTSTVYPASWTNYHNVRTSRLNGVERGPWYPYTNGADQIGVPNTFAWRDRTNAIVAPLPGVAWEVLLTYWEPFTTWTVGTATPGSVTLNIPDDLIQPVIQNGAAYYLNKAVSPQSAMLDRQLFDKHIVESRGFYSRTRTVIPNREDYR